jgi:type VI secretion system FHA domain protein
MEFGHGGGTIGRSLESDWVLPDGQRYLSSRHASIDYRSGSYYIVDTSTNGVYVNDSEQPVGRGNPQRLFTGDRIRLGEYEIAVDVIDEDDTRETMADGHEDPVSRAQRVPPPDPTRADMVAPHEITAVGIEMIINESAEISQIQRLNKANAAALRLEEDPAVPKSGATSINTSAITLPRAEPPPVSAAAHVPLGAPKRKAKTNTAPPAPAAAAPQPRSEPAPTPTQAAAVASGSVTLDAFFRGAGLPAPKLDDKEAEQMLHRLGQLMREVVLGLGENLHLRSEQKNVLRVPTTTIQPQNNNPLKFSAGVEEAMNNLLFRQSAEYLSAVDAVRETFTDIRQHQQHLLAAMRTAVADYIGRLDPEALENKVANGKSGVLANATNKLRYWDVFKDLYQVVAQRQPGQFPQQFIEELARAYEIEAGRAPPATNPRQAKIG